MGMYRNYKKNIEAVLLVCCLSAGCLLGCEQQEIIEETKEEEVKIPMILTVNPSTGKRNGGRLSSKSETAKCDGYTSGGRNRYSDAALLL